MTNFKKLFLIAILATNAFSTNISAQASHYNTAQQMLYSIPYSFCCLKLTKGLIYEKLAKLPTSTPECVIKELLHKGTINILFGTVGLTVLQLTKLMINQ